MFSVTQLSTKERYWLLECGIKTGISYPYYEAGKVYVEVGAYRNIPDTCHRNVY